QKYSGECRNAILGADTVFLNAQRSEYQNKALCGIIPKTRYINKNFYIPDKYDVIAISPEDYNFLKLNYSDFNIKKFYGLTFQQSINFLKNYSTIISMPLHGVILSYIAGVEKIFACVYDEKVLNFVKEAENEINILDEKILNEEKENINIKINRCSKLEDFSTRAYNGYFLK
ncbi:MAG: polysaccharide pyruvyl transferase family protein, partial [Candidatus Muiribacteriota bacterium]